MYTFMELLRLYRCILEDTLDGFLYLYLVYVYILS